MSALRSVRVAFLFGINLILVFALVRIAAKTTSTSAEAHSPAKADARTITMEVTAYCPCEECCGPWATLSSPNDKRVTSIGDDAAICDGVAADPAILPYRTKLWIPGVGSREVDDTGGAMRQSAKEGIYHIDLRFPTHAEARTWGVQYLNVTLLNSRL